MVSKYLLLCDHCLQEISTTPQFVDQPEFHEYYQVHHMRKGVIDEYHLHLNCLRFWADVVSLEKPTFVRGNDQIDQLTERYGTPMIGLPGDE